MKQMKTESSPSLSNGKGFYHKIAQKIFRRPRVSDIKMDKYGSFVWHAIDDEKTYISFPKKWNLNSENGKIIIPFN